VEKLKRTLALLLMAALMLTASTLSVYADDDEGEEVEEGEEGTIGGLGGDDGEEEGRGMPGFEVAFGIAGALAAARLFRLRV
jgi:hypothetical protein